MLWHISEWLLPPPPLHQGAPRAKTHSGVSWLDLHGADAQTLRLVCMEPPAIHQLLQFRFPTLALILVGFWFMNLWFSVFPLLGGEQFSLWPQLPDRSKGCSFFSWFTFSLVRMEWWLPETPDRLHQRPEATVYHFVKLEDRAKQGGERRRQFGEGVEKEGREYKRFKGI